MAMVSSPQGSKVPRGALYPFPKGLGIHEGESTLPPLRSINLRLAVDKFNREGALAKRTYSLVAGLAALALSAQLAEGEAGAGVCARDLEPPGV